MALRVHVAADPARVPPGVHVLDLLELHHAAPLASWAAIVRRAQDSAYRLACEGASEVAIVGPITTGHHTRRRLRQWAKRYEFVLTFHDRRTS